LLAGILTICKDIELKAEVERCLFTNSLIGATIQDGGTRERSDDVTELSLLGHV